MVFLFMGVFIVFKFLSKGLCILELVILLLMSMTSWFLFIKKWPRYFAKHIVVYCCWCLAVSVQILEKVCWKRSMECMRKIQIRY